MRIENDEVLNELYDEEFEKIPFIFKFSKKRYIVTICIACALIVATLVLIILLHETSSKELIDPVPGMLYRSEMNAYNIGLAIALFCAGAGLAVLMILIIGAKWFENRAFKKAANLAHKIHLAEELKEKARWMNRET